MKRIISLLMVVILCFSICITASAKSVYRTDAYTTIITASDFQESDLEAYNSFYPDLLQVVKDYGVKTPDAFLIGGDYTRSDLGASANPGIIKVKDITKKYYPDADKNSIICIQGNHDYFSAGLTKTGLHDMGTFMLYAINEDDYPEKQDMFGSLATKSTASKLKTALEKLIGRNEKRPVIIMTHVPLHHSTRKDGGDNKYSSILFNVINEAAKKLDIVFLFGHNHSGYYDDYIGGFSNFIAPGETIRIPNPSKPSEYKNEVLNFTYTNYGYMDIYKKIDAKHQPMLGMIQITENEIVFAKFSRDGVHDSHTVSRMNPTAADENNFVAGSKIFSNVIWNIVYRLKNIILIFFKK